MKKLVKVLRNSIILGLSLLTLSCQIGLGEAVDLIAPVLEITAPVSTDAILSVSKEMTLEGRASDEVGVKTLTVTVEETNDQYKWENSWQHFENGQWVAYNNASFNGTPQSFNWALTISFDGTTSGEDRTIIIKVTDEQKNEGKKSKEERIVTVDIKEPTVTIIEPNPTSNYTIAESYYKSYELQDNSVLSSLLNGNIKISGSQKEDSKLDHLYVLIDDLSDNSLPPGGLKALAKLSDEEKAMHKNMIIADLQGSRNWEVEITEETINSKSFKEIEVYDDERNKKFSGRHLLRLVTESHDMAGNIEQKIHGWFIYDSNADIPWIVANFGANDEETFARNPENYKVYPSCKLQEYIYDDDGIKDIIVKTEIYDNGQWVLLGAPKSYKADLEKENFPSYKNIEVNAISDNKSFRITTTCIDVNGKVGKEIVKYLGVTDVNPPTLNIETPKANSSLIAGGVIDSSGNFKITGTVVDDGPIQSLQMIRVANKNTKIMHNYWNSENWKAEKLNTGDKLFTIPLKGGETAEGGYYTKTIWDTTNDKEVQYNIFTDFGISQTEVINTLNLVFMATDESGSTTISSLNLQGDIEAPKLKIEKIIVIKNGTEKEYPFYKNGSEIIPMLETFTKNGSSIIEKIRFEGTWSDNSTALWGDKLSEITLTCGNKAFEVKRKTDGTWVSDEMTPEDVTTASVEAEITDLGGNTTKASAAYYVSSSKPYLVRFASTNPDGYYKVGDKITITMEYNKRVTFSGETGAILNLNNGGTAVYDTTSNTNGTAKHNYIYTVRSGDTIAKNTKLDVEEILVNSGTVWKDTDGVSIESATKLPDADLRLNAVRSIYIDKEAPKISQITPITSAGYYKKGKEIFIQATFSEDVHYLDALGKETDDVSPIRLYFDTDKYTDTVLKTSASTLLFKYTVKDGDNYSPLKLIKKIDFGGLKVLDAAKNEMTSFAIPDDLSTAGINLDTEKPSSPVISYSFTSGQTIYDDSFKFSITELESNSSVIKYSVDADKGDKKTWEDYNGEKIISTNGTYYITAYQEDAAGNRSDDAKTVTVTLNKGELLSSITTTVVDGTYKETYDGKPKEIPISLNFRIPVTISDTSKLKLSIKGSDNKEVYANFVSAATADGRTTVNYKYSLKAGDSCDLLDVLGIYESDGITQAIIEDLNRQRVSKWVTVDKDFSKEGTQNISVNRTIKVVTEPLNIESVDLDQSGEHPVLKITFNADIVRSSGDIIIEQEAGENNSKYIPPAILSEAQYLQYSTDIQAFYEEGTNGCDEFGNSDLNKKYILKYKYDTKTDSVSTLKTELIKAGVLRVEASVKSLNTSIEGKVMSIVLKDGLALPVKGTNYKVTIPLTIAKNMLNKPLEVAIGDTTYDSINKTISREIFYEGVEKPVIRINKKQETISGTTVTQPLQAGVLLDCQTPGAEIYYVNNSTKTSDTNGKTYDHSLDTKAAIDNGVTKISWTPTVGVVTKNSEKYDNKEFEIGNTSTTDGIKVFLHAKAFTETASSESTYESAYRTVITINTTPGNGLKYEWIRGGDQPSGGVSTPNFPFSWDSKEYNKVRAMTENGSNWYWVTWNINTTAYVGFLSGDMPNDAGENGPKEWTWTSCSYVGRKEQYPVFPGESYYFLGSGMDHWSNGGFGYQAKHKESR